MSTTPKVQPTTALPARQVRPRFGGLAFAAVPVFAFVLALVLTWLFTAAPWSVHTAVGGTDSALLGPGFYTKEQTAEGVPFRWTNGPANFRVPYLRSSYIVSFRADTATGQPYPLKLLDGQRRWATVELQPGFRTYHIFWPSSLDRYWPAGLGERDFTLLAEARSLREGDNRIYGAAFAELAARDLNIGAVPIAPAVLITVTLAALWVVFHLSVFGQLSKGNTGGEAAQENLTIAFNANTAVNGERYSWSFRPQSPAASRLSWLFAFVALALPVLYNVLVWNPPVGGNFTWLPLIWLPWFIALVLTGTALALLAWQGKRGALLACGLVAAVFVGLLASLNGSWSVTGPDFGWHLNHGGSWARVFRAHGFYPFGFPLILYLGQLAGDLPLLFGRLTGALATAATFGATIALVWRIQGRAFAWLGGAVLLGAPIVVAYGVLPSTDAPMAAWAALALLALCWHTTLGWRGALLGGAALGFGYLFRFQAIVFVPAVLVWLVFQTPPNLPRRLVWLRRTGRFALPLLFVAGFVLASAPQWLLDIRDFGRPYFTTQYVNIWSFAFGKESGLPDGAATTQLWYILNYDPSLLWRHWAENLRQAGFETLHGALVWPFGVLAFMGFALACLGLRDRRAFLLALWSAVYVAAVALTYNKERFFLPVMPALVVFVVAVVQQAVFRIESGRWRTVALAVCASALWCWAMLHLIDAERELILYLIA